ncbi:MAG TPA: FeS assembly scaffold SufA, partial [Aestuariivirgaceae bacterium]|nr:FeS assembly scaffold SufA [Aestuariivirgaceae bacterium]
MTGLRPSPKVMTLTDAAAERVREIMIRSDRPVAGLRVGVKNGGCAGMEYTM